MRSRVILGLSLIANLILAIGWFWAGKNAAPKATGLIAATNSITSTNVRTAVIVRRQFFSWQELESRDYPTYIKNLRDIGCPEQTIRDIIIADVTAMLRDKYQTPTSQLKPNPKWWTNFRDPSGPDSEANPTNAIWAERGAILSQLLGSDWAVRSLSQPGQTNSYQNLVLATLEVNPVLQGLSADKKLAVATLLSQTASGGSDATNQPATLTPEWDPVKALAFEKNRWAKLSEILSIDQLEAAKLHFSNHGDNLRNEFDALPGFDTQPEEFRKVFKATEAIDEQLLALEGEVTPAAQEQREKLQRDREAAIRTALTPLRYDQFVRLQDPAYLTAIESLANGGNANALGLLYAINREATAEHERILNDETLTETQREIELKKLELEQLKATAQALGEKLLEDAAQKETAPKSEPKKIHTVAAGEGLERIARIYGVDPNALRAANPGANFEKLPAGTPISVPLRLIYPLPPPSE